MEYRSNRDASPRVSLSHAIATGTAPDGGLYLPTAVPRADVAALNLETDRVRFSEAVLRPYFTGDKLEVCLRRACEAAFSLSQPLRFLEQSTAMLELYHGPTCAFKDFGARFLAQCVGFQRETCWPMPHYDIFVATSGDTGGAVAAAFHSLPGVRVVVLFPSGRVSAPQRAHLSCWPNNVLPIAVDGSFDDCQCIVRELLSRSSIEQRTCANSINIGRLLPQIAYTAWAAVRYQRLTGHAPGFIVPTGNLGNALGAYMARTMGFPVREIVLATNANRYLADYFNDIAAAPTSVVHTLASAMDVAKPGNLARVTALMNRDELLACSEVVLAQDADIRAAMGAAFRQRGLAVCPHTATALHALGTRRTPHWVVVATAHPGKFPEVLRSVTGTAPELPVAVQRQLARARPCTPVAARADAVEAVLAAGQAA
ncbi:MAG: threonine synthase [Planctomycetes bacterium]|nr:threonine synthase [Planctomycetota bacterium]